MLDVIDSSWILIIYCFEKPSCVTVRYASTNRHETLCRAVVPRESAGGLTGTSCRVQAGGRTHSWDGLLREQAAFFPYSEVIDLVSRADYMQGTRMSFKSEEDAIHFAEKQGILVHFLHYLT